MASVNGSSTQQVPIKTGVPRRSFLGPFLLYINDMPNVCKNSSVAMFADDTTLITSEKRIGNLLNVDIGHTSKWLACNKLTINIDKCETMFFGCGKPSDILLDKTIIPYKNSVKILGVHIDKNLRFREHIDYVTKKLSQFCGLVCRIQSLHPINFLMFYKSI